MSKVSLGSLPPPSPIPLRTLRSHRSSQDSLPSSDITSLNLADSSSVPGIQRSPSFAQSITPSVQSAEQRHVNNEEGPSRKAVDQDADVSRTGDGEDGRLIASLPPVDGGRAAWTYLISATLLECMVWGLPLAYGTFLTHYYEVFPEGESTLLPQVGTISSGLMYLLLTPTAHFLSNYPHLRNPSMWFGLVLIVTGLIGAAFGSSAGALIGTQAVMYSMGGVCLYCPVTSYQWEWWQRRRGMANGIMFAGTGLGGIIFPFLCDALLTRFGRKTTLISLAIAYAILLSINIPFIRPRLPLPIRSRPLRLSKNKGSQLRSRSGSPTADEQKEKTKVDYSFLKGRAFWFIFAGVLFQGLAGFVPGTYLPSFATRIDLNATAGTLSLALMNLARIPGQIVIGHLSDKRDGRTLIVGMAVASSISVFAIWGAATGEAALLVFALFFGTFAGSYTALFPKFISVVAGDDPTLPNILFAAFSFARGIGNIASGFVSTGLMSISPSFKIGAYAVEGYGMLIIWTGTLLLASGIGAAYEGLKRD